MALKQRNINFSKELIKRINKDIMKEYHQTGKFLGFGTMVRKRLNELYGVQE